MNKSSPDKPKFLTGIPKWANNWVGWIVLTWIGVVAVARLVDALAE